MTVDYYKVYAVMTPIIVCVPDEVLLLEQINTFLGTWHVPSDPVNVFTLYILIKIFSTSLVLATHLHYLISETCHLFVIFQSAGTLFDFPFQNTILWSNILMIIRLIGPAEQEVATTRDTLVGHLHAREWEIKSTKTLSLPPQ